MASPYASLEDLQAYLGKEPPADSQRLLAQAQDRIDDALVSARYATDASGNPTDAVVIAAFKKATCQQAEWWLQNGDEFDQNATFTSFAIEGISVTRDTAIPVRSRLCERAYATLRGVVTGTPFSSTLLPGKPTT